MRAPDREFTRAARDPTRVRPADALYAHESDRPMTRDRRGAPCAWVHLGTRKGNASVSGSRTIVGSLHFTSRSALKTLSSIRILWNFPEIVTFLDEKIDIGAGASFSVFSSHFKNASR